MQSAAQKDVDEAMVEASVIERGEINRLSPLLCLGLAILCGRSRVGIGGVGVLPRNVGRMKHPGCCRSSSDTAHFEVHILDVLFSRQRGGKEQAVGVE